MPQQTKQEHTNKYVNNTVQAGRIFTEPEMSKTGKGVTIMKFTLWNESGKYPGRHQAYHKVVMFGEVAEKFAHKKKGDWIKVFGCLQTVTDENKKTTLELKAYGAEDI